MPRDLVTLDRINAVPAQDTARATGRYYLSNKSENTQRAYRGAVKDFGACFGVDAIEPHQITDASLAHYIEQRARNGHKPATIATRVSILTTLAQDHGHSVTGSRYRDALGAISRAHGTRPNQAKGFTLPDYHRALAACDTSTNLGARDAVLLALAYSTASRASELVSFQFEDIDFDARAILLRRSKTDQTGEGVWKHLSGDAIEAIKRWSVLVSAPSGPILRSVNKGGGIGSKGITTRALSKNIKRLLGADYSPHSIRVGFVQSAVERGHTIPEISLTTGQSPQTVQRYFDKTDQKNSAAAKMLG